MASLQGDFAEEINEMLPAEDSVPCQYCVMPTSEALHPKERIFCLCNIHHAVSKH